MGARRTQIVLEIDPDARPLSGSVSIDGAEARPFHSWIALGHAIETAVSQARDIAETATSLPQERT